MASRISLQKTIAIAAFIIACVCTQTAAQTVDFAPEPVRRFKVANLLVNSARFDTTLDAAYQNIEDPDPYVWYLLNYFIQVEWPQRYVNGAWAEQPPAWEFYNPLAPTVVTRDILERWDFLHGGPSGLMLGEEVTPDMACYWEAPLDARILPELATFDVLVITHHRLLALSDQERRVLRSAVDAGAQLLVDSAATGVPGSAMRVGWATRLGGVTGGNFYAGAGSVPAAVSPNGATPDAPDPADPAALDPIDAANAAYFATPATFLQAALAPWQAFIVDLEFGATALGVANLPNPFNALITAPLWIDDAGITSLVGATGRLEVSDPLLHPLIDDGGFSYIGAARYGAGRIVTSAADLTSMVNDGAFAGAVTLTTGGQANPNSGAICGAPASIVWGPALDAPVRMLLNLAAWSDEWTAGGMDSRRSGAASGPTADRLDVDFELLRAAWAGYTAGVATPVASPVVVDGIAYIVANADVAPVLIAVDTDPQRDFDNNGDPDDGARNANLVAAGLGVLTDELPGPGATAIRELDVLWVAILRDASQCTPAVFEAPSPGGNYEEIVAVGDNAGEVTFYAALPQMGRVLDDVVAAVVVGTLDLKTYLPTCGPVVGITIARDIAYIVTAGDAADDGAVFVIDLATQAPVDPAAPYIPATASSNITSPATVAVVPDPHNESAQDETLYFMESTQGAGSTAVLHAIVTHTWDESLRPLSMPDSNDKAYLMRGLDWDGAGSVRGGHCYMDQARPIRVRAHGYPLDVDGLGADDVNVLYVGGGNGLLGSGVQAVGFFAAAGSPRPNGYPDTLPWPPQELTADYATDLSVVPCKWEFHGPPGSGYPVDPAFGLPAAPAPVVSPNNMVICSLAEGIAGSGVVAVLRDLGYQTGPIRNAAGAPVFGPIEFDLYHATTGLGQQSFDAETARDRLVYWINIPGANAVPGTLNGITGSPACTDEVAVVPFTSNIAIELGGVVALELHDLYVNLGSPPGLNGAPQSAAMPSEMAGIVDLADPTTWDTTAWPWEMHVYDAFTMVEILPVTPGVPPIPAWEPIPTHNAIRFYELHAGRRVLIQWIDRTSANSLGVGASGTTNPFVYHEYHQVPSMVRWQYPEMVFNNGGPIPRPAFSDVNGDSIADAGEVIDPLLLPVPMAPLHVDFETGLVTYDVRYGVSGALPASLYLNSASPIPGHVTSAICAPTITGDKVTVPVNYVHPVDSCGNVQSEALLRFSLDPRDGMADDNTHEPWPGALVPWPPSNNAVPLDPPWETYRYIDHGDNSGYVPYWRHHFESLGVPLEHEPINASYDLLSFVSQVTTGLNSGSHQLAVAGDRMVAITVTDTGPSGPGGGGLRQILHTYGVTDGVAIGDQNRVILVDEQGNPDREIGSSAFYEAAAATNVSLPERLSRTSAVHRLEYVGRPNSVLLADSGSDRVIEIARDSMGEWVEWITRNREHPNPDSVERTAFVDTAGYGWDLAPGLPSDIKSPRDAYRLYPELLVPLNGRPARREWTFIADTGNHRLLGLESTRYLDVLAPERVPVTGGDLVWLSDPDQLVVRPGQGNVPLIMDYPAGGALESTGVGDLSPASDYEYTSVVPVNYPSLTAGDGSINPFGFSGVVAAVNNYAVVTPINPDVAQVADPTAPASYDVDGYGHPYPMELGEGASIVKLGRVDHSLAASTGSMPDGRIEWAFNTIYRYDDLRGTFLPYRRLEKVYDIDVQFVPDWTGAGGASQAGYVLSICAQTSILDQITDPLTTVAESEEGMYPVTYFPALGPESGTQLMQMGAVPCEGLAILGLPPGGLGGAMNAASGLSDDQVGGNPWVFAEPNYAASMAAIYAVGGAAPLNPIAPYTGVPDTVAVGAPDWTYSYFKPVSVEVQYRYGRRQPIAVPGPGSVEDDRSPMSYLIVNGHELKSEVIEVEPPPATAPGLPGRLKRVLPRVDAYGAVLEMSRRQLARDHRDVWPPVVGSTLDTRSTDERHRKPWLGAPGVDGLLSTYYLMQPLSAAHRRQELRSEVP